MNIKIQQLELTNFKCFSHKLITFDNDITTISGRNGVGKTTVADAILWCLFGKNSQGQSDFDLKTHDDNGKPIPNLDHSVEMVLFVGDEYNSHSVAIKRTLKETWIKKRGTDEQVFKNNTTDYLINGESYTAGDYKKYIAQLVDEEVFKAITSPTYFPSLKWQVQRDFLTKMVDMSDVVPTKEELEDALAEIAPNQTIIEYRKHLSYQIKQIKDKLDKIPVRLEEQNKALPESLDYNTLQMEYDNLTNTIKDIDEKVVAIRSGNGQDLKKDDIRQQIDSLYKRQQDIQYNLTQKDREKESEIRNKVTELSIKFNTLVSTQRDLENQITSFDTLSKRCRENAEKTFKEEQAEIRAKWPLTQAKFNDSTDGCCELCGQILPADQLEKAKEQFNIRTSDFKQKLTERAAKAKELLASAEQEAKDYDNKKAEAEQKLEEIKESINTTFAEKQRVEKEKAELPTTEQVIANNEEYSSITKQIGELREQLDSVSVTSEYERQELESLAAKKETYNNRLKQLSSQLATRDMRLKILAIIDGINEEQKDLVRQLSELERKEDVVRHYQDRHNTILEERINKHFSLVQWKMFRTVNNGGDPFDEPYCECFVNGVAYHDGLNQAARLNAGLDIIKTLCKHYNVFAPIVIDNSESNLNILQTESQQIRLDVSDNDFSIK